MNRSIRHTFLAATAACGLWLAPATAQTTATTDPVGAMTVPISGTNGGSFEKYTFLGVPFERPAEFFDSVNSYAPNEITLSSGGLAVNAFSSGFMVEIESGANQGVTSTITSNTEDTLTTFDDLSAFLGNGDTVVVRAYQTIASVFGENNEAGLKSATSFSTADQILVPDGSGSFTTFYYKSGGVGGTGWRTTTNAVADAGGAVLYPSDALIIKRRGNSSLTLQLTGSVRSQNLIVPIEQGFTWLSSPFPVSSTLNQVFGSDGGELIGSTSIQSADQVLVPDGSGSFDFYYYKNGGVGGTGWRSSTDAVNDLGETEITNGSGVFIVKRNSAPFNLRQSPPF